MGKRPSQCAERSFPAHFHQTAVPQELEGDTEIYLLIEAAGKEEKGTNTSLPSPPHQSRLGLWSGQRPGVASFGVISHYLVVGPLLTLAYMRWFIGKEMSIVLVSRMIPRSLTLGPYSYVESFPAISISPFPLRFVSSSLFSGWSISPKLFCMNGGRANRPSSLISFFPSMAPSKNLGDGLGEGLATRYLLFFSFSCFILLREAELVIVRIKTFV